MARLGRKPASEPTMVYTYRRPILIVQLLAEIETREWIPAIENLCKSWGIDPVKEYKTERIDFAATLKKLAQSALGEARKEDEHGYEGHSG